MRNDAQFGHIEKPRNENLFIPGLNVVEAAGIKSTEGVFEFFNNYDDLRLNLLSRLPFFVFSRALWWKLVPADSRWLGHIVGKWVAGRVCGADC